MAFNFKILPFKRLLINLLNFFKMIKLILNASCSVVIFILILLKSIILILKKNLAIKIFALIILLFIKESLINLSRFSK